MMKRTLSILLALVLALGSLPVAAGAVSSGLNTLDTPHPYADYDESEDNGTLSTANGIDAEDAYVYGEVGSIADNDTMDYFVFAIPGPRRLVLYGVSGAGGAGTTSFSICGADGAVIAYANYLGVDEYYDDTFEMEVDLPAGTYYIRVMDPYNWVGYGLATQLTPLLETPRVTVSNRASDGKIKLSWDPVPGAGQYYILRADNKIFINPTLLYPEGTGYTDTSAQAGTTYYYKVYAASEDPNFLNSMYCAPVARTCDLPRPDGVRAVRNDATGKVRISWNAVPGADKYTLYIYDESGDLVKSTTTTGTALNHTSAVLGKTYTYKVKAVDGDRSAANSAFSTAVSGTAICGTPQLSLRNIPSTGKVRLSWNAVSGADKYTLYIYDESGKLVKSTTTTGTALTHNSASMGKTYTYKVKAVNSADARADSGYSAAVSGKAVYATPELTVSNIASTGKIRVSWNAIAGASSYKLYRSTNGVDWVLAATVTNTAVTHNSAKVGETWYYKVKAVGTAANADSDFSSSKSCTCHLPAPVLTVTRNSAGKPRLVWTAVAGATKYKIYGSTDGGHSFELLSAVSGTAVSHNSAQSGVTYLYKIVAVASNTAANSAYSNTVSAVSG